MNGNGKPRSRTRDYGTVHRRLRESVAQAVATGTVRCARGPECFSAEIVDGVLVGGLISPSEPWDLGHVDGTRSYGGPEHRRCNRATKARMPERYAAPGKWSRKWYPNPPKGTVSLNGPDEPAEVYVGDGVWRELAD